MYAMPQPFSVPMGPLDRRTSGSSSIPSLPSQPSAWEPSMMAEWAPPAPPPGYITVGPPGTPSPYTSPSSSFVPASPFSRSLPQTPLSLRYPVPLDIGPTSATPPPGSSKENSTNVYVSGLPRNVTDESFLYLVSQYGSIFSSKVVRKGTQDPPVGFVQYTSPQMAQAALRQLDGKHWGGVTLKAKMALRDKDKGVDCKPSANLYVCNLPPHFTTADLRRTFEPHGRIVSLVALTDPVTGKGRGTGFVRFSSVKEARLAKEAMHGAPLRPDLPLEVKFAESNADRAQRLKGRLGAPSSPPMSPHYHDDPPPIVATPSAPPPMTESFHKRQRPAPLKAPAGAPETGEEGPDALFLAGIGDLEAVLEDVFPAPTPTSAKQLVDDLLMLQTPRRGDHMETSDAWDPPGLSDNGSDPLTAHPVEGRGNPWEGPWSPDVSVAESRIWKFTDPTSGSPSVSSVGPASPVACPPEASSTVKIDGLPNSTTEVDLYRLCSPYGAILQVNLDASGPRFVAFVQFRTPEEARDAQARLQTCESGGRLTVTA